MPFLLSAAPETPTNAPACGPVRLAPPLSFLIQPDFRTAYISRGKVVENRPMESNLVRMELDTGDYGRFGFHHWNISSLTDCRQNVHRRAFNERDYALFAHYDWKFNEDWRLSTEVMQYWITLCGYTPEYRQRKSDATIAEWRYIQSLENPYLVPFMLLRRGYHPDDWLYIRAGLRRAFPLGGGFTFTPQYYAELGDEAHFEKRYGARANGGRYHSGMQASNLILELSYRVNANLALFANVHQFDIVSADARRSTKNSTNRSVRSDLTAGIVGLRLKF